MKIYKKLKELDIVENEKEYSELVWLRTIKLNGYPVIDPKADIKKGDKLSIGYVIIDID